MIPVQYIDPEDLALYAMRLLPAEETERIRMHLQHSPEARQEMAELYGSLAAFACTSEMQEPSAGVRERLLKQVQGEKKVTPIDRGREVSMAPLPVDPVSAGLDLEPMRRGVAARVLPWIGWALAAGLGFEVANLHQQREHLQRTVAEDRTQLAQTQQSADAAKEVMDTVKDPAAVHVALTSTGVKPPPEGRASYVPDKGSLVFIASNLEPLEPLKTYELWLIPADGRDPMPAGTFRPDGRGNASVVLPALSKGVAAKAFGVTIEDGDGAQKPTLPIVLQGLAS